MDFSQPDINKKISSLKYCVLIPTYNNAGTLKRVIDGVLHYTSNVIIVNDGSTDDTPKILSEYLQLHIIDLPHNRGKGNALKVGLKKAEDMGFDYAISIDSDGQHYPEDIPKFVKTLIESPNKNILLIGARNLNADGMPKKNSFANKFSNFWYWAETGEKLDDTQSGFRLYPAKNINRINLITTKYEFELESMVKAQWNGIMVRNIPIEVHYDEVERVSHYRPFKDFMRISLLNTWLVLVAVFWIKPRNFFRKYKQKGFKRFFMEDLLGSGDSNLKKTFSVVLGTFIGLSPFWGFQTVLAIGLAAFFRLNKAISFAFSNISLPPVIPFIIYASLKIGGFVTGKTFSLDLSSIDKNFDIKTHLIQYLAGSFVLATVMAVLLGAITFVILQFFKEQKIQPGRE